MLRQMFVLLAYTSTTKGKVMTHDELLKHLDEKLSWKNNTEYGAAYLALRAVVELHKPQEITLPEGDWGMNCGHCDIGLTYPCPTIQAIEKELQ